MNPHLRVLALLLAIGTGCAEPPEQGPLPDSTMVSVLMELHLAVARAESTNEIPPNIRDSILIAYGVDSTQYAGAITYYAANPKKYAEIYSRVLDRLNTDRLPLGEPIDDDALVPPTRGVR